MVCFLLKEAWGRWGSGGNNVSLVGLSPRDTGGGVPTWCGPSGIGHGVGPWGGAFLFRQEGEG